MMSIFCSLSLELDDLFNVSYNGFFSLKDLLAIKLGTYEKSLRKQIEIATEHVLSCEVRFFTRIQSSLFSNKVND
jgi:hypothetical protein